MSIYGSLSKDEYAKLVPVGHQKEFDLIWNKMAERNTELCAKIKNLNSMLIKSDDFNESEKNPHYIHTGRPNELQRLTIDMYEFLVNSRLDARVDQLETITVNTELREAKEMEKGLRLVTSEMFGAVQCDFYKDGDDVYMTGEQLGTAIGYAEPIKSISNLVNRNSRLATSGFSTLTKLMTVDGKKREVRVFTEDGIYEVSMLAKTEKAETFRDFVRHILKALRRGEARVITETPSDEVGMMRAKAMLKNANVREAKFILQTLEKFPRLSGVSVESAVMKALEIVTGPRSMPLPEIEPKYYTATDIGDETGLSSMKVGQIAKANNLKVEPYGIWVMDKSRHSSKQVETFRYNETGRQALLGLITQRKAG